MPLLGTGLSHNFGRGNKLFELSNHLGNVLVTVNDKKLGVSSNNNVVDYFNPQVVSAQDYYPFGMLQVGRVFNTSGYRYGFNGKEKDGEIIGEGNLYDYGFRIYNAKIAKFLSVDPLTQSYPWYTPYQFSGNKPISCIDLDGLEEKMAIYTYQKDDNGIEHTTYLEIPWQKHQQSPEHGSKGIATYYYFYDNKTKKTNFLYAYSTEVEVAEEGWFSKLFGKKHLMPQIQIFGSGRDYMGGEYDPSKPIFSFNLSTDELFSLLMLGTEGPEKYGPISEVDKFEEGTKSTNKLTEIYDKVKEIMDEKSKPETKREPVIIEEVREGKWEYYLRYKNGDFKEASYVYELPEQKIVGKDGAPDTLKKVKFKTPPAPKKDIPRKN